MDEPGGIRAVVLGTSPPAHALRPGRAGTGLMVTTGHASLLLDCGPGVARRVLEAGGDLRALEAVLLTHHHWDHIADLSAFVLGRWEHSLYGTRAGEPAAAVLQVYGPGGTLELIGRLFGDEGVFAGDIASRLAPELGGRLYRAAGVQGEIAHPRPGAHELAAGDTVWFGQTKITTSSAQHCQPYLLSLAYRIDAHGRSLVFAGDSAESADVAALARGVDVLIHEGASLERDRVSDENLNVHSSAVTVGRTAAVAGARRLILVHHEIDRDDRAARTAIEREVRLNFDGDLEIAHELLVIDV